MNPRRAIHFFAAASVSFLASGHLMAQDAHYWTLQYGPRAGLLGGAIIGSTTNYSAAFYNPGGLSLVADPGFALSTQVFERQSLNLEDGAGPGLDLGTSRTGLEPSLIAGRLPFGGDRHTWAYSVLSRHRVDTDISQSVVQFGDEIDPGQALSGAAGTFRLENALRETWGGVTWAYRASPRLGVGVTTFLSWRQKSTRRELVAQIIGLQGRGAALIDLNTYEYTVARMLWKAGLQWHASERLRLGLTLTTPGLNAFGDAQIGRNLGEFGVDPDADLLSAALKSGTDTEYRSPLSIGVGGAFSMGPSQLHVSAEWFDAVPEYSIAAIPSTGSGADTLDLAIIHAARSVVNWGVGLEHRFSARVHGFASVVSDMSAAPRNPSSAQNAGTAPFDVHIGTIGADVEAGEFSFTLGVGYGFGTTKAREALNFFDLAEGARVASDSAELRYRAWRLIFGFEL